MDKNSNSYIIMYAAVVTIIVAVALAFISESLREKQEINELLAKKTDILKSVGKADVENIEAYFDQSVRGVVIDSEGEVKEGLKAIDIDLQKEKKIKDLTKRSFPLFIYKSETGEETYIIPMRGAGLWDAIWGFIAIEDDFNTIAGASFDHKAETPGLGARITEVNFQAEFVGKQIMDGDEFTGIELKKGILKKPERQVTLLTGATVTSNGVSAMIQSDLSNYLPYFKRIKTLNYE